jgi:hypothetical protein
MVRCYTGKVGKPVERLSSSSTIAIVSAVLSAIAMSPGVSVLVHATAPHSIPSLVLRARVTPSSSCTATGGHGSANLRSPSSSSAASLWLYRGALYDPLDGRKIASVQGLELVRPVDDTTGLAVHPLLNHENATYHDAKTFWSKKIFCYTTTAEEDDSPRFGPASNSPSVDRTGWTSPSETLLKYVRVRRQSPRKFIPLDQAVAVYETATTLISRKRHGVAEDSQPSLSSTPPPRAPQSSRLTFPSNDDEEMVVHTEFPNGQTLWSATQGCRYNPDTAGIDFTVYAKLRSRKSPLHAPDLTAAPTTTDPARLATAAARRQPNSGGSSVIVSPKRSAIVQFGSASGTMESRHKFGARETYSYRNIPLPPPGSDMIGDGSTIHRTKRRWDVLPTLFTFLRSKEPGLGKLRWLPEASSILDSGLLTTIYYTRYGEGPPFYAPGRMCMLELQARPIANLHEATPVLRGLLVGTGGVTGRRGPPVVAGFGWEDDAVTCGSLAQSVMTDGAANTIQSSWNLLGRAPNGGGRRRRRSSPSSLSTNLLRLLPTTSLGDDLRSTNGSGSIGGYTRLSRWARKATLQGMAMWERLRMATIVQSSIK